MQYGQSPTPKVVDRRIRWTRTKDSVVWINNAPSTTRNNQNTNTLLVLQRHNRTQRMMETCGPQQNDKEQTKSGNLNDAGCRFHLQTPDYNSLGWLVLQCLSNIFWSLVVVVVGVRVCDGCVSSSARSRILGSKHLLCGRQAMCDCSSSSFQCDLSATYFSVAH